MGDNPGYGGTDVNIVNYGDTEYGAEVNSNNELKVFSRITDGIVAGQARLDASTEVLETIDYAHHEIHSGSHYFIKNWVEITAATYEFLIITPNTTKWGHFTFSHMADEQYSAEIFEGTTVSNNGTAITAVNNNRNSSNTAGILFYTAPTVTADGTSILRDRKDKKLISRNESEIVLKQNTKYLFRITREDIDDIILDYRFSWYEHTDRN